ncbi:MAG: circularly permuted type 2 ATP-grasp protein [Acidimicrobiales bacterium]|nr:circularly permuted type 2 ATP-grasp protein [Acidimicrobiales bacterium]
MTVLDGYDTGGFFDEVVEAGGAVRAHYRPLFERLDSFGATELARRQRLKDAIFHTQGITFTVYGDEEGTERTFPLDLIPRVIAADEWATLEAGLVQRVRALNAFLEDLYAGEQAALADGVVPRELVESAEGYLPQAIGIPAPHGARCVIAGIDVVRDSAGRYVVLEDNLRNPSGVSYVLENRSAMTRVLPVAFHQSAVRPVSLYPHMLLEALSSVAPVGGSAPRVVLLTPGRYNSAYFEHAFLARQMGIELVEANDLIMVDDSVQMRTTRGLRRVDVIYRRIDDEYLDPLAFRPDSLLGVPGLIDVARSGNVTICNALGNGVADDKAVYVFVPEMIRYYLGEEPILANVETYRLDEPDQLTMVLGRLDELVVKPVAASGGYGMLIGPTATDEEIGSFTAKLQADPRGYIAQEVVQLSRAPTLVDSGFEGRHIDLRPFIVAGDQVQVLPGGLTRVALRRGSLVVNSSQGGGSKDTWVLAASDPEADVVAGATGTRARRRSEVVLARVAADLFWAGRYLERAEDTARLLDVAYHAVLEEPAGEVGARLEEVLDVLSLVGEFSATGLELDGDAVARFLVTDTTNPGSIRSAIATARENIRSIQDQVSRELWESLNSFHWLLADRKIDAELASDPFSVFGLVRRGCQTVIGAIDDTMSHNDGWRFLVMGRSIERALITTRLLSVYLSALVSGDRVIAFHHWVAVLRSAGAYQEYQKVFQASVDPTDAVEFLLQAQRFPRSVLRCLTTSEQALRDLRTPETARDSWRQIGRLRADVEFADVGVLVGDDLDRILRDVAQRLELFSTTIGHELFGVPRLDAGPRASLAQEA